MAGTRHEEVIKVRVFVTGPNNLFLSDEQIEYALKSSMFPIETTSTAGEAMGVEDSVKNWAQMRSVAHEDMPLPPFAPGDQKPGWVRSHVEASDGVIVIMGMDDRASDFDALRYAKELGKPFHVAVVDQAKF